MKKRCLPELWSVQACVKWSVAAASTASSLRSCDKEGSTNHIPHSISTFSPALLHLPFNAKARKKQKIKKT